jgi:hypothetical protein
MMIYFGYPINISPKMCCYITYKSLSKMTVPVRETMVKGIDGKWPRRETESLG